MNGIAACAVVALGAGLACGTSAAAAPPPPANDAGLSQAPPLASFTAPGMDAAASTEPENLFSVAYLKLLWADTTRIVSAPMRWDDTDWRNFSCVALGLVATAAVADRPIRDWVQRNRTPGKGVDRFLKDIEPFGQKNYSFPVLAGFYLVGLAQDDPNAKEVALDGVASSLVASGLVTSTLKEVFGRARPNAKLGPHHFTPFGGAHSFPSGHATQAFAVASVIAAHYDSSWIDGSAYGLATLVGMARVEHDAHWTSDVIGGALIGTLIGREIVSFNRDYRAQHANLLPSVGTDGQQLTLSWTF